MTSTDRYLIVVDGPGDRMLDRDELAAQVAAATGLTATCLGAGTDWALPHEQLNEPQWRDRPPVAAELQVGGAMIDLPAVGLMPAVFVRARGPHFETEYVMPGDVRWLGAHVTLYRNAIAAALSRTAAERKRRGLGRIPQVWHPGGAGK